MQLPHLLDGFLAYWWSEEMLVLNSNSCILNFRHDGVETVVMFLVISVSVLLSGIVFFMICVIVSNIFLSSSVFSSGSQSKVVWFASLQEYFKRRPSRTYIQNKRKNTWDKQLTARFYRWYFIFPCNNISIFPFWVQFWETIRKTNIYDLIY